MTTGLSHASQGAGSATTEQHQIAGLDVLVEGTGARTVVMLHGWPDTSALWAPQVAAWRTQMRCVRFTWPGFDRRHPRRRYSLEDLLQALDQVIDTLSPGQPVTLLMHDWGCVFGYRYLQAHPDKVAAVVAVDVGDAGSPAHLAELDWRAKLGMLGYQGLLALAWYLPRGLGDAITRRVARWAHAPGDMAEVGSHMNYPYAVQWSTGYGRQPALPACPLLFIHGSRKPFAFHSEGWAAAVAARPHGQVLALPSGHWVMRGQPAAFNASVKDWLDRLR